MFVPIFRTQKYWTVHWAAKPVYDDGLSVFVPSLISSPITHFRMSTTSWNHVSVDVSKDKHNFAHFASQKSFQQGEFKNQEPAIQKWLDNLPFQKESLFVILESTGTYSDRLMHTLSKNSITFAAVNPAKSAAMSKVLNRNNKNDKQDALVLYELGSKLELTPHKMPSEQQKRRIELLSVLDSIQKMETRLKNQIHAFSFRVNPDLTASSALEEILKTVQEKIQNINTELNTLNEGDDEAQKLIQRICTIKGVGLGTATAVVTIFGDLSQFESHKQFVKHIGLAPGEHSSGSSVRGKSRINRKGNYKIRALLFNCARSAIQHNPDCKELYQRLEKAGKNGNQALTAVMHKLARVIFGVVRSNQDFNQDFLESRKKLN